MENGSVKCGVWKMRSMINEEYDKFSAHFSTGGPGLEGRRIQDIRKCMGIRNDRDKS